MKKDAGHMLDAIQSFKSIRPLVIGDVMVDAYLWGKVERISPEAPVPIVSVNQRLSRLGGAANVARNLASLGSKPILCSVIGDDSRGYEFLQLMEGEGLDPDGIVKCSNRITTTKFRVIGNNVQMLRVDEETDKLMRKSEEQELWTKIKALIAGGLVDVIIFEDYDKGAITKNLISKTISLAHEFGLPVAVDPKFRHFHDYIHADLFKPNLKELREGLKLGIDTHDTSQLKDALDLCHDLFEHRIVLVTLSHDGIVVSEGAQKLGRKSYRFPAQVREIADVSGAGDTVISVAALAMRAGLNISDLAWMANLAGGLVCEEVGVVPISLNRLTTEVERLYHLQRT